MLFAAINELFLTLIYKFLTHGIEQLGQIVNL